VFANATKSISSNLQTMENSPFNVTNLSPTSEKGPNSPDADAKNKKDTKKSKALGGLVFERTPPVEKETEKTPLTKLFDRSEKSVEKTPDSKVEQDTSHELSEADAQYVTEQIAIERRAEITDEPIAEDAESQAAMAAAQEFYDKIIDEGLDPETAAADTLATVESGEPLPNRVAETQEDDTDIAVPIRPLVTGTPQPPPPSRPPINGPSAQASPSPNLPSIITTPANYQPNVAPPPATQNVYIPYYDRSRAFGDALVGGLVGYLIGKRRGRIKTERKLLPVQKKIEREVTSLKDSIARTEFTIRETAKQRVRERQTESFVGLRNPQTVTETVIMDRRERPLPAPELHRKPNLGAPPERIGKVLVAAEAIALAPLEIERQKAEPIDKSSVEKQVETLSRNELLTLSEKVIVEGSTLRQVYETHLVGERGLRRLVAEYLRGGDVIKAFKREIIEREIDFERDPKLRDTVRKNLRSSGTGGSSTLQKLLQQAGVAPGEESKAEIAQARAQQLQQAKRQAKQASKRKLIDVSLVTTIAVLLSLVIMLAVNKL
jgi:hypothetical protein